MKMSDVLKTIAEHENIKRGYRVHFERVCDGFLEGDYFPDRNEDLIETEEVAWELAGKFARATYGKCVNIYVVDHKSCPVPGYTERKIRNR